MQTFEQQRLEIFGALMKLGPENLSAEEKHTLSAKANSSMKGTIYILGQLVLSFSYLVY